jgi:hypothetical protein
MPKPDWFPVFSWELEELKGLLMGAVEDALESINIQLGKAKDEILSEIATLEQQIADNAVNPDTLQALKDKAQALDDVVPDVVPPSDTTPPDTGTGDVTPPDSGFTESVDVNPA